MKKLITLLLSIITSTHGHAQYIMHIAGNNSCYAFDTSNDDIPAIRASVGAPNCICRDAAGNLYFGEGRVRKISAATGLVTTIAGGGAATATGDNIPATTAALFGAYGLCTDVAGNLYIGDNGSRIRKINTTTGIITTVAGYYSTIPTGYTGDGGPATAAGLHQPGGVAVDATGNIYIADRNNHAIRKVTAATGIITTIAGTGAMGDGGDGGPATAAILNRPTGVCVDKASNVYIADQSNNRVRKITVATGIITTVAGKGTVGTGAYSGDGAPATAADLQDPVRVAMDKTGDLYIADNSNGRIRRVSAATGIITTYAGSGLPLTILDSAGNGGPATAATMMPTDLCFDTCGNLYISSSGCRIRAVTAVLPTTGKLCGYVYNSVPATGVQPGGMVVFPNPARGQLTVQVTTPTQQHATITLTNTIGQKLLELNARTNSPTLLQPGVPPGIYFISVVTEQPRYMQRVLVE